MYKMDKKGETKTEYSVDGHCMTRNICLRWHRTNTFLINMCIFLLSVQYSQTSVFIFLCYNLLLFFYGKYIRFSVLIDSFLHEHKNQSHLWGFILQYLLALILWTDVNMFFSVQINQASFPFSCTSTCWVLHYVCRALPCQFTCPTPCIFQILRRYTLWWKSLFHTLLNSLYILLVQYYTGVSSFFRYTVSEVFSRASNILESSCGVSVS